MLFLDSVHAKTINLSKKGGKKYFHQIGYALGQNLAKFEALKASEAESKTSMLFLDSVHAKTIIQSKKGGKKYFHQIGYALGQNLAKFEALKACEAESKTSMLFWTQCMLKPSSKAKKGVKKYFHLKDLNANSIVCFCYQYNKKNEEMKKKLAGCVLR